MKLKKLAAALGVALPLAFAAVTAQAAFSVMSFQDDNIDFLLTPVTVGGVTSLAPKLTGAFAPGDVLVSVFEMPSFTVGGVNAIPANYELTGIAAIQIVGGNGNLDNPFTFKAYDGGFNAISPVAVTNGGAGEGATIAMWLNSTLDFNLNLDFTTAPAANCDSLAYCLAEASAGELIQVDGFGGDADDFWQSTLAILGGNDPAIVYGTSGAVTVATFLAAQTTFYNSLGPITYQNIADGAFCPAGSAALDGCVAGPVISGPISGGGGQIPLNAGIRADGAFARSDIDAVKLMNVVPEPGTLALAGLSLLGLAAVRRRRQSS